MGERYAVSRADGSGPVAAFVDEIDPVVFTFGAGLTLLFVVVFALAPQTAADLVSGANGFVLSHFNWAFLIVMLFFVAFLFFLILGPWGNLRFGDEPPEYSFVSYFTMMYSAGLAAGIVFWGPAEALLHYATVPPLYGGVADASAAAMPIAVQYSMFHWALTQWSCFTVMGLGIGYYVYNYGAPLRVSSVLTPFIGAENVTDSYWAKLIDIVAVFATLGGVSTSLGFIGSQFLTGLRFQWGIQFGDVGTFLVITGMTVVFTISVVLGVDKGIRRLSNFNMGLFAVLLVATLVVGPTWFVLQLGTDALGGFVTDFVAMSLFIDTASNGEWANAWTVFYWAWPLAWSPFAGLFIARISRGRSVREVAFTGIGATGIATTPWFIVLGGTGVWLQHAGGANLLGPINRLGESVSGYVLYGALPGGMFLLAGFLVLVTTFFITSADSSTLAVSMMTTGGEEHPSTVIRVFWGLMLGAVASVLMVIGGVDALQSAAIVTGGPFAIVCLVAVLGLAKSFREQYGNLLFQEETVIFGRDRSTDGTTGDQGTAENDD